MISLWKAELLLLSGDPDMFYPEGDGLTFGQVWQTMKPLLERDGDFGYDPRWERLYQTVLLALWSGHRQDGHDLGRLLALMRVILPGSNYLVHGREDFARKRRIIAHRDGAEAALAEVNVIPKGGLLGPGSDNLAAWNYLRLHQSLAPEIPVYLMADPARCNEWDWSLTLDLLRGCALEPAAREERKVHTGMAQDARALGMDEDFIEDILRHESALTEARRERQSFGARICREPEAWTLEKAGPEARRLWRQVDDAELELLRDWDILSAAWAGAREDEEDYLYLTEQNPCDKLKKAKKGESPMKKIALLMALCLMLTALTGCGGDTVAEQTYTLECGVTITAGAGLRETSYDSVDGALEEDRYSIVFTSLPWVDGSLSEDEFIEYVTELLKEEGIKAKFKRDSQGNLMYSYTQAVDGTDYFYYLTVHSGGSGWWLCEMSCLAAMKPLYEGRFARWSATVRLPESGDVSVDADDTERYELDNGAALTAPAGMEVYSLGERDYALENRDLYMVMVEENKQAYGLEDMTLEEYGQFLMDNTGLNARYEKDSFGNLAADYYTEIEGVDYYCYGIVLETGTSFWYFDIYCEADLVDTYQSAMAQWCDSLTLVDTPMFSVEQTRVYELECGARITAMEGLTEDNEGMDEGSAYLYGSGMYIGVIWMDRAEYGLQGFTREDLGAEFEADGSSGSFAVDSYGSYASAYYDESDGNEYYNYMTIVEEADGFWLCMMYCLSSNESVYAEYMPQWAATLSPIE